MTQDRTASQSATIGEDGVDSSAVLVVGCAPDFTEELASSVSQGTRKVLAARTGSECMEVIRGNRVVLIVMSVALPDMDARELFTGLRENPQTASIPVLFVGQRISDSVKKHACLIESDGHMEGDPSAGEAAAWVTARLRRTREVARVGRRDPQTGLPNRAAFCDDFTQTCQTCHAASEPVALAVVSVDECAQGPEDRAQSAKDEIVPRVATILSACLRATDLVARWSSEEFVLLLPGEDASGAARAIEKALAALRNVTATDNGGQLKGVTLSAGLTVVTSATPVTAAVADAERYLYKVKAAGGNGVASSQSQLHRRANRALIVIDDRVMSLVIKGVLEKEELEVFHVKEADLAVDACAGRRRFQVMVIDERLPNRDGFAALEKLKAIPRNRHVPTIMLLSEKTEDRVTRALELGASDYDGRPFAPLPFVSRVRKLIAQTRTTGPAHSGSYRVLVVDDAAKHLILAASALHQYGGFCVYLARGDEDARNRLASLAVDIVVAPLAMIRSGRLSLATGPGEAARRDVALVATVVSDGYDPACIQQHGIKGVLKTPFDALTLGREIESLVDISAAGKPCDAPPDHLEREFQRIMMPGVTVGAL